MYAESRIWVFYSVLGESAFHKIQKSYTSATLNAGTLTFTIETCGLYFFKEVSTATVKFFNSYLVISPAL